MIVCVHVYVCNVCAWQMVAHICLIALAAKGLKPSTKQAHKWMCPPPPHFAHLPVPKNLELSENVWSENVWSEKFLSKLFLLENHISGQIDGAVICLLKK